MKAVKIMYKTHFDVKNLRWKVCPVHIHILYCNVDFNSLYFFKIKNTTS